MIKRTTTYAFAHTRQYELQHFSTVYPFTYFSPF